MKTPTSSPSSPQPAGTPELPRGWAAAALAVTAVFLVIGFVIGRTEWGQPQPPPFADLGEVAPPPQDIPATRPPAPPPPQQSPVRPAQTPRSDIPPVQMPYTTQPEQPATPQAFPSQESPAGAGAPPVAPSVPVAPAPSPQGPSPATGTAMPPSQRQDPSLRAPGQLPPVVSPGFEDIVFITGDGERYHRQGCASARGGQPVTRQQAAAQGRTPCQRCRP